LALNPRQKEVHYNLGTAYAERKDMQNAIEELKSAVLLDPDYAAAWSNLALVYQKTGQDAEALAAHEKVITLGKGQSQNYFNAGILYAKVNQPDPAIARLTKAIEMEPEKYRQMLRAELKQVHSPLDSIRYLEKFARLLTGPEPKPKP
jgi:Tfp pilus assembly protein PilF